ncbi:MAG: hydroxyacylglutathione hydrolase [Aquabacterium sp.]|jgi:hydroxyacylglutathione hydrolase|uniref:hydroxyacylglutathione hydrolase n=1 Tax=Aquabacterium sp. TaxID=1872578 RepID=UPI002A36878F|nr:hydroxyacylglutathione hydrolase [Aquabacterium sp.]MDX9842157.1 hydroxyacylglutathione hydrolase [Aquabacterium sp.]
MNLLALPAFADNYIWMIHNGAEAMVVDPGDAAPVSDALKRYGLKLTAILVTHHHGDHVGGLAALQRDDLPVYGPAAEAIGGVTQPVADGDIVIWQGLRFVVHDVAGHTRGHIAYFAPDGLGATDAAPLAFVGDTLFSGGCGRVFEGTMDQMHRSLNRIAQWPVSTRLCAAHEYTLSNLRFAQAVEPGNAALAQHVAHCEALRAAGLPTLPTTLATELAINPFLRCTEAAVQSAARAHDAADTAPASVFAALRLWKNTF